MLSAVDIVLNGYSPPIPGSSGSLRIRIDETKIDGTKAQVQVQWGSTDSFLGVSITSLLTPGKDAIKETLTTGSNGKPGHLVFVASQNGVTYSGNILLSDFDRGVLDVVEEGRRVRYLLNESTLPCQAPSDAELEVFAKSIAYDTTLSVGEQVVGTAYVVDKIFNDPATDFQAYGLTCGDMAPPVLAVRGTAELSDITSDANPQGVGFDQFQANVGPVTAWLRAEQDQTGMAPEITGHSLGGSLAQWFATAYTTASPQNDLTEVVTFNAAGISASYAKLFVPGQVSQGVRHYINSGDIVSMAGEAFIAGSWTLAKSTFGSAFDQLNFVNKHTYPMLAASINGKAQPNVTLKTFTNVDWLNSPLFLYNTPDYYEFLTAAKVVLGAVDPVLGQLPLDLVFRGTTEAARSSVGGTLYSAGIPTLVQQIQQIVSTAMRTGKVQATLPPVDLDFGSVLDVHAQDLAVRYDASKSRLEIKGRVTLPKLFGATADFAGSNFIEIRDDGIDLAGSLTVPEVPIIPNLWEFHNLKLSLNTKTHRVSATGSMSFGPQLDLSLPLFDEMFSGHVIDAQLSGVITPEGFSCSGALELLGGLGESVRAIVKVDFVHKSLTFNGVLKYLGGSITANTFLRADSNFSVMAMGSATVTVPSGVPLIGGETFTGADFALAYDPKAPLSQDYVSVTPTLIGLAVGFKVSFDGSVMLLD